MYLTPTSAPVGKFNDPKLRTGRRKILFGEWQYIRSKAVLGARGTSPHREVIRVTAGLTRGPIRNRAQMTECLVVTLAPSSIIPYLSTFSISTPELLNTDKSPLLAVLILPSCSQHPELLLSSQHHLPTASQNAFRTLREAPIVFLILEQFSV